MLMLRKYKRYGEGLLNKTRIQDYETLELKLGMNLVSFIFFKNYPFDIKFSQIMATSIDY